MRINSFAILSALSLATSGFAFQADPMMTINGESISKTEYYRRMEYLPGIGKKMGQDFVVFPPGLWTIEQIVTERLLLQLAKSKGLLPTDTEVDAEIKERSATDPNFTKEWLTSGRTEGELKYQVRFELAQFKVLTEGVNVADQQIEAYYKDNISNFTTPRRARLRVIVVSDDATVDAVNKDLAAGKAFADVATDRSVDVSHVKGGEFGVVPVASLSKEVQDAINAIKPGQVTPWIKAPNQNIRFLLEEILPETVAPLDANMKKQLKKQVMMDRGYVKNDLRKEMRDMRLKAKIDITSKPFADTYKEFIRVYLESGGADTPAPVKS